MKKIFLIVTLAITTILFASCSCGNHSAKEVETTDVETVVDTTAVDSTAVETLEIAE